MSYYRKTKCAGIYEIRCLTNDKRYIGSSCNTGYRLRDHRVALRRGTHTNHHLQSAWNLYGEENFTFTVIERCDESVLFQQEEYWMRKFDTLNNDKGYNMVLPGTVKSDSLNPVPTKERTQPKGREIVVLELGADPQVKLAMDIIPEYNVLGKHLYRILNYWRALKYNERPKEKTKSYKGLIFVYEEDYDETFDYFNHKRVRPPREKRPHTPRVYKRKESVIPYEERNIRRCPIILEHVTTGEIIEGSSVKQSIKEYGLVGSKVYKCLKAPFKKYSHKGYYIRYKE